MIETKLRVVPPGARRNDYLPLLRLADDSEAEIRGTYQQGELFALDDALGEPVAVVLALPLPDGAVELKAVAVAERLQGRGIGRLLVSAVLEDLRRRDVRRVVVGSASSSLGPVAFYQKAGFRLHSIERDFFTVARGYRPGLEEDGIPVRDMVWMDLELRPPAR